MKRSRVTTLSEQLGVRMRLGIVLAAGLLVALITAGVTALLGAGSIALVAAVIVGILAVVVTYLIIGPGEDFQLRSMWMGGLGAAELVIGGIMVGTNTLKVLSGCMALEGLVVFFVCYIMGGGFSGDNDISAGEGGGEGF